MHTTTLATTRTWTLAGILTLAMFAIPAIAIAEDSSDVTPTTSASSDVTPGDSQASGGSSGMSSSPTRVAAAQPVTLSSHPSKGDMGGNDLSAPAPAMPLAASEGSDSLSGFGPSSGTVVGNRGLELRDEVLRLRQSVNLNSQEFQNQRGGGTAGAVQYHSTVAAITARLQNGTTRGNPILLRQWDEADAALNEVSSSMGRLNSLQTAVDADASLASYLLESIQAAFELSGAVDEDHDQLKILRDEVSRLVVQLDYLRNQITNDIQRQTMYVTTERANLQALAFAIQRGELVGSSLANRPVVVNAPPVQSMPTAMIPQNQASGPAPGTFGPHPMSPSALMQEEAPSPMAAPMSPAPTAGLMPTPDGSNVSPTSGHLLVLIRYNQPVVDYEAQLSQAVGQALERRPNAQFSVVAVSPSSGDPADLAKEQENAGRDADAVKRSLVQLGLSPSRISQASTQTQNASTPEVHVYVR